MADEDIEILSKEELDRTKKNICLSNLGKGSKYKFIIACWDTNQRGISI